MRFFDPLRWVIRFPQVHRLVHRISAPGEPTVNDDGSLQYPDCLIDRYVWGRLMGESGFAESLERGRADFEAGRFTQYRAEDER